ncbi:flagellar hook-length control protein FliK [Candidatus Methylomirabilis sp.]|uniref:flagellar hook-length control protein FliK n=1 Tax=Candidatus Methylomirabilis sp. TaxID=2032687 RepID=UPI002A6916B7|nr:flagellar hook-length control protein FliK [Candidatus Methylomirabilis sp.]
MIPLGIAGQVTSGVFQDIPAETASSQGVSDFLLLFEQAMGISAVAQAVDGTVSEDLIGVSDAAEAVTTRTVDQGLSGVSDGKDQADRSIDPALAILIAALGRPQQETQVLAVPGLDRVVDLPTSTIVATPPVETTLQVAALSPSLSPQGARQTPEPADNLPSTLFRVEQPTDSPAAIPVEIGSLLRIEAATQQAEASVVTLQPRPLPSGTHVTLGPVDAETSDPRTVRQPVTPFRGAMEAVRIEQPETTPSSEPRATVVLPPPGASVTLGPVDAETSDPRTVRQPVTPFRGAMEAIRIEQPETTPSSEPRATVVLPPPGAHVTQEPTDAPSDQPTDSPTTIPTEIGTRLQPEEAAITASPIKSDSLKENISTHAKPDLPEEGATSSVMPGRVNLSPPPRMTSATGVQDGTSRSNGDRVIEQVGGLPPMVTSLEGHARAVVASSEETAGRSSLPQHAGALFSTPSDSSEVVGSEVFEGERSPERVQMGRATSDRAALPQGSPRIEATQDMQQDGSTSDPEGGSHSSGHSSSPPGDGRQIGADFTLVAGPRVEGPRAGSAAPPMHTGSLVDQVAEQVAEAARMSLRNEGGQVHLHLHPKALGELLIDISWKEGGIVAAIKAQSHIAGDLLASDLGRLRTALDKQGIPVSGLGVQVGLDLRHWNFEGNGFRPSPTIEYARGTIPWRDRGSVLPNAVSMKTDSLIDITV